MYDLLMAHLASIAFDFENDHLFAVGDLVDRGPDSAKVVALLEQPWFHSVMGNHEELLMMAYQGHVAHHRKNGGLWYEHLDQTERDYLYNLVSALPYAITTFSPSGRKIGIVHADVWGDDWDEFTRKLHKDKVHGHAMWDRDRIYSALGNQPVVTTIANVDHVYMGHTPLIAPVTKGNMSWIDTRAYQNGNITIREVK